MRKIAAILVVAAALVATGCSSKASEDYLKSTARTNPLIYAHIVVWKDVSAAVTDQKKPLGEWDTFPLKTFKVYVSGREECAQVRKEVPNPDPTAPFLLACSKDSQHAVIMEAKDGKPVWSAGPMLVMLYDGTIFWHGGVLMVSMTNTGASARTSSSTLSVQQMKALDAELLSRWQEAYQKYFQRDLPK